MQSNCIASDHYVWKCNGQRVASMYLWQGKWKASVGQDVHTFSKEADARAYIMRALRLT